MMRHPEAAKLEAGDVVVLTGPPGAGKSTVAHALIDRLDHAVLVRGDDVLACVVRGFIPPWDPMSAEQNLAALAATAATVREYANAGYPVIVDAVLGPWHLDTFAVTLGRPFTYIVLRPSKTVTVARAVGRGPGSLTEAGPVEFMWDQFAALGSYEDHVIDTSALDAAGAADAVLAARAKCGLEPSAD